MSRSLELVEALLHPTLTTAEVYRRLRHKDRSTADKLKQNTYYHKDGKDCKDNPCNLVKWLRDAAIRD